MSDLDTDLWVEEPPLSAEQIRLLDREELRRDLATHSPKWRQLTEAELEAVPMLIDLVNFDESPASGWALHRDADGKHWARYVEPAARPMGDRDWIKLSAAIIASSVVAVILVTTGVAALVQVLS